MQARFGLKALTSILILAISCAPQPTDGESTPSAVESVRQKGKLAMLCFPTLGGGVAPILSTA